jgi:hypothetical protein
MKRNIAKAFRKQEKSKIKLYTSTGFPDNQRSGREKMAWGNMCSEKLRVLRKG